ncbi:unnamed protein product [Amoebophrya sp. A120]|nr:unnamed protein product [Amoebophrya sp. A120]|eukprot:GSA120T00015172001.1
MSILKMLEGPRPAAGLQHRNVLTLQTENEICAHLRAAEGEGPKHAHYGSRFQSSKRSIAIFLVVSTLTRTRRTKFSAATECPPYLLQVVSTCPIFLFGGSRPRWIWNHVVCTLRLQVLHFVAC